MALFNVIRSEGSGDTLVWKYQDPEGKDRITHGSRLIVNEGQEAVFLKSGHAFDVFGPGSHTLSTKNLPLLRKFLNLPFGGETPFPAEIYFVNKTSRLDYKWGTLNPIQVEDPEYQVLLSIRAYGQYGLKIGDSRKFVTGFVGTMREWKNKDVTNHFNGLVLTCVQSYIAQYLVHRNISIARIMAYLDELSDMVEGRIREEFSAFGIDTLNFRITSINIPESEMKKIQEAQIRYGVDDNSFERHVIDRFLDAMANTPVGGSRFPRSPGSQAGGGTLINPGTTGMPARVGTSTQGGSGILRQSIRTQSNEEHGTKMETTNEAKDMAQGPPQLPRIAKISLECPSCSARSPSGSKFCSRCGSSLNSVACYSCGAIVSADAHFCQNCGNPMNKGDGSDCR